MEKREVWLDYLRAFACALVSLGHLFRSFQDAAILQDSVLASFFDQVIYHFHVYIFFFCSGFLFQRSFFKCSGKRECLKKRFQKCLDFVIVYILFSGITYFIKTVLSGDVNSPVEQSFLTVLLKEPINQMWYLYAISVIMLFVPAVRSDGVCTGTLLAALCMRAFMYVPACAEAIPLPLGYLFTYGIWFVLGEIWAYKRVTLNKWLAIVFAAVFFALNLLEYAYGVSNAVLDTVLTFTGVLASAELFRMATKDKEKMSFVWKLLSKYMLQIYLLHTICAAGIRIILLKLGITNFLVHFVMGMVFSFVVPILCAAFAERVKLLNFVFYPTKTVKELKK